MGYVLSIYGKDSTVTQSTWRFDADTEEAAIALAAVILGRLKWDSAGLSSSTGKKIMIATTGISPMESHK